MAASKNKQCPAFENRQRSRTSLCDIELTSNCLPKPEEVCYAGERA